MTEAILALSIISFIFSCVALYQANPWTVINLVGKALKKGNPSLMVRSYDCLGEIVFHGWKKHNYGKEIDALYKYHNLEFIYDGYKARKITKKKVKN